MRGLDGEDGADLGEGVASKAVGRDGDKLDGDFHSQGGGHKLGCVGGCDVGFKGVDRRKQGDLAHVLGAGLGDACRQGTRGKHENRAGKGFGNKLQCEGAGGAGGIGCGVVAEGQGGGGRGGDGGVEGVGGQFADEGGLAWRVGEDVSLSGVQANAVDGLEDDQSFGGGFAGGGGPGASEGDKAFALAVG